MAAAMIDEVTGVEVWEEDTRGREQRAKGDGKSSNINPGGAPYNASFDMQRRV